MRKQNSFRNKKTSLLRGSFFYVRNIVRPAACRNNPPVFCAAGDMRGGAVLPLPVISAAGCLRCGAICPLQPFPPFFRGFVLSFCGFRRNHRVWRRFPPFPWQRRRASSSPDKLFFSLSSASLPFSASSSAFSSTRAIYSSCRSSSFLPSLFIVSASLRALFVIIFLGGFGAVIFQFLYRFSGQFQHFVSEDADCFTYRHTC